MSLVPIKLSLIPMVLPPFWFPLFGLCSLPIFLEPTDFTTSDIITHGLSFGYVSCLHYFLITFGIWHYQKLYFCKVNILNCSFIYLNDLL